MAKWLFIAGALLLAVGAALQFAPWAVNWFGKLPGDLRLGSGSTRVFIPITSMIVLSIVLTVIVNLFRR
jgi:H+/Cl- antiporter ClcA